MANGLVNTQTGYLALKYGQKNELGDVKPCQRDIMLFDTYVAGTSHIKRIEELEKDLKLDDRLEFFREPDNPQDPNAIVVKDTNGKKVGYVPMKDNVVFSRLMDAGKLLYGKITAKELRGKWVKIYMDIYLHE